MSCVFDDASIDFDCLRQIISRIYQGNTDVTTFRMVLKQVDAGLSLYGMPVSATSYSDMSHVLVELESLIPQEDVFETANYVQIVLLLIELLSILRKG